MAAKKNAPPTERTWWYLRKNRSSLAFEPKQTKKAVNAGERTFIQVGSTMLQVPSAHVFDSFEAAAHALTPKTVWCLQGGEIFEAKQVLQQTPTARDGQRVWTKHIFASRSEALETQKMELERALSEHLKHATTLKKQLRENEKALAAERRRTSRRVTN